MSFSFFYVTKKAVDEWSSYDYADHYYSPAVVAERTTQELHELLPVNALPTALQIAASEGEGGPANHSEDLLRKVIVDSLGPATTPTVKAEGSLNGFSSNASGGGTGPYSPGPSSLPDLTYDPSYQQPWSNPSLTPTTPTSHNTNASSNMQEDYGPFSNR